MTSPNTPLVAATNLTVGYGGRAVLEDVDFLARPGERVGVLGPNGGGKTTLFKAILGELAPLRGELAVHGRCATVPQTDRSRLDYPVSVLDVALMGTLGRLPWWRRAGRGERREARDALELVDMADRGRASYGELSGGQRQRVLIARALVQKAELLLLDEPYRGLDTASAAGLTSLIDRLAGEGIGVMIASHDLDQAERWDRVLWVDHRQVAFGPPAEAIAKGEAAASHVHRRV